MPGFDGTGPAGQGPMTGGGRGYCVLPLSSWGRQNPAGLPNAVNPLSRFQNLQAGPFNPGAMQFGGRGMGRGMGRRRGRCGW